jgi:hypothetical protein
VRIEGKLTNEAGEFIANGPCEVDLEQHQVTMWPSWELHMLERERGELALELADSRRLRISDKHLTFKLQGATQQRITVYRLRVLESVPQHLAAGYSEPAPAAPEPSESTNAGEPRLRIVRTEQGS